MILIPLKLKYRNPNKKLNVRDKIDPHCNLAASDLCPRGTYTFQGGRFKATSSNQGSASKVKTLKPRRKAYGPF